MNEAAISDPVLDLRDRLQQVGDQGMRDTCVTFAMTALHEAHHDGSSPPPELRLSEEFLHWGARQRDGLPSNEDGTTYAAATETLEQVGQAEYDLWPYDDQRDPHKSGYAPSAAALKNAADYRAAHERRSLDVGALRAELVAGRPVAIAIPVWDDLESAHDGVNAVPASASSMPLDHAVVIVGHDPTADAVLLRNSWGTDWCQDGHGWFEDKLLVAAREVGWVLSPLPASTLNEQEK